MIAMLVESVSAVFWLVLGADKNALMAIAQNSLIHVNTFALKAVQRLSLARGSPLNSGSIPTTLHIDPNRTLAKKSVTPISSAKTLISLPGHVLTGTFHYTSVKNSNINANST